MAVKIRLRRMGTKGKPFYRMVVADSRSPRDGRFIEILGHYDPRTEPPTLKIDEEKALLWLNRGAQPSDTVEALLKKENIFQKFLASKEKPAKKSSAPAVEVVAPAVEVVAPAEEPEAEPKKKAAPKKKPTASVKPKPAKPKVAKAKKVAAETPAAEPEAVAAEPETIAETEAAPEEQPTEEQG